MKDGIFISHRSIDQQIADMLLDFFVSLGIERDRVFCSSLPGNDVRQKISPEVKEALKNSRINIAILSKDYQESPYCLNEAGILWFNDTPVIAIAMPEITFQNMHMFGFLDDEYKLRKLDNNLDITAICDEVCEATGYSNPKSTIVTKEAQKLMEKYKKYLETRANLTLNQKNMNFMDISSYPITFEYYYSSQNTDKLEKKSANLLEIFKFISIEMLNNGITENKVEQVIKSKLFEECENVKFKDSQMIKMILVKLKAAGLIDAESNGYILYWKLTKQGEKLRNDIAFSL